MAATGMSLYDQDGNVAKNAAGTTMFIGATGVTNTVTLSGGVMTGTLDNAGAMTANSRSVAGKASDLIFQIGANGSLDQRVGLHVDNMSSGYLGLSGAALAAAAATDPKTVIQVSVATREEANDAIKVIDAATNQVSGTRADLGALQNRLEHTLNNLGVT
jgi:flagellin